jgi:hypothetical protein
VADQKQFGHWECDLIARVFARIRSHAGFTWSFNSAKVAAENAARQAEAAEARGPMLIRAGLLTLLIGKLLVGVLANPLLARRFNRWRSNRTLRHGFHRAGAVPAAAFCILAYGLLAWTVAAQAPPSRLTTAPVNREWQGLVAAMLDRALDGLSKSGEAVFSAITGLINIVLDAAASALTTMPWPVTMAIIVILAWQLAGNRVAIFTAATLAYLAVLGFWEKSLETVVLLGASAVLFLLIGIPLGIWCGRRPTVYTAIRSILDFMQTMPAFVYLIPVIALFGIGTPRSCGSPRLACRACRQASARWSKPMVLPPLVPADARGPAARRPVDHGRREPDHPDVPVDGGRRLADRRQGAGRGRAERAAICSGRPGLAGGASHSSLRDDHRPDRQGKARS